MLEEIKLLIDRAQRFIKVAKKVFKHGYFEVVIDRAYYAVYYAALAMLLTRGIQIKEPSSVLSLFAYHFVRPGEIDEEHAVIYRRLKEMKEVSDMDLYVAFNKKDVREAIGSAEKFVGRMKDYLYARKKE